MRMCQHLSLITLDSKNTEFIPKFIRYVEFMSEQIQCLERNSDSTKTLINKHRFDLQERYEIRNNYHHRKIPLLLRELCIIRSNKEYFLITRKEHLQSTQFYRYLSGVQSSSTDTKIYQQQLQQSIKILDEVKQDVGQYEKYLDQLKTEVVQKTHQMTSKADNLFQIQYEQTQIQSQIKLLQKQILYEKLSYNEVKRQYSAISTTVTTSNGDNSESDYWERKNVQVDELYREQRSLKSQEMILVNNLENIKDRNQHQLNRLQEEHVNLTKLISQIEMNIKKQADSLLLLQNDFNVYRTNTKSKKQPAVVTTKTNTQHITQEPAPLFNKINRAAWQPAQQQNPSPIKSTSESEFTKPPTKQKSLGPNLQSRLEALEAAMGVRLNLAKRQGRHSLSNTAASSPMQLSPTSSSLTVNSPLPNSLSVSSRHSMSLRTSQGVQRSASSCDAENRVGPRKRLKPSIPNENSVLSTSNVAAIATIKKYPPTVRRPLITTNAIPTRSTQPKQSTPIKPRASPMDTSSPRLSRSSTSSNSSSNSSNYRTPIGSISPKVSCTPSPKQTSLKQSLSQTSANPPRRASSTHNCQKSSSVFGEQFSDEIIKINLLWIDLNELDNESRTEVILQFGSIENYLREQNTFFRKQQHHEQQLKTLPKNKTIINRSRFHLSLTKKDRLELL